MKYMSIFLFFLFFLKFFKCKHYQYPFFSFLNVHSNKNVSEDLEELNKINEVLVSNEIEDEEDEEDEEGHLKTSDFDDIAIEGLHEAEEQASVDLENKEIENVLDSEIYRIVQERLKKLWYIGKCRRDYSNICPLKWKQSAYDENLCIPPETYEGQCRSISFLNSKDVDKELFAWKCEVEWPCIKSPKLNVLGKCPLRWTHIEGNLCIAPEDYIGKCSLATDFSDYDYEMRVKWATECNAQWPIQPKSEHAIISKKILRSSSGGPIEEDGDIKMFHHTV